MAQETGRLSAADYENMYLRYLPPGAFWRAIAAAGRPFRYLLSGWSIEAARFDARAHDMLDESRPNSCDELAAAWEENLGLPETGMSTPEDLDARRALIWAKYRARGSSNAAHYAGVMAAHGATELECGYISPYQPASCDAMNAETDPRCYDQRWLFVWQWNLTLEAARRSDFESYMNTVKPAHCVFKYDYN